VLKLGQGLTDEAADVVLEAAAKGWRARRRRGVCACTAALAQGLR